MIEDKALGILKQMAELLLKHEALGNHVRAVDNLAGLLVKHQYNDDNAVAAEKLTLTQNEIAHIAHALAVHKNGISGDLLLKPDGIRQQGQQVLVLPWE